MHRRQDPGLPLLLHCGLGLELRVVFVTLHLGFAVKELPGNPNAVMFIGVLPYNKSKGLGFRVWGLGFRTSANLPRLRHPLLQSAFCIEAGAPKLSMLLLLVTKRLGLGKDFCYNMGSSRGDQVRYSPKSNSPILNPLQP